MVVMFEVMFDLVYGYCECEVIVGEVFVWVFCEIGKIFG